MATDGHDWRALTERLVQSGTRSQRGLVEPMYDPNTYSHEGLDDGCFFCGSPTPWDLPQAHKSTCAWIDAMDALGHPHPDHVVNDEKART